MTHSPPVPPGNQSPYPVIEPPHTHEPVPETRPRSVRDAIPQALIAGAAVAGVAAVATVATAIVRSRRRKTAAKTALKGPTRRRKTATKTAAKAPTREEAKPGGGIQATAAKPSPKRSAPSKPKSRATKRAPVTPPAVTKPEKAVAKLQRRASGDDPSERGRRDAARIAMGEEHEVRYWTEKFGVDREALQRAVDSVGNGVDAVEAKLRRM